MQYFYSCKKIQFSVENFEIFLIFAQNIDCGFIEAVLTIYVLYHNLCFREKIRKNVYLCKPQFYYIKVGCKGVTLHGLVIMMPGGLVKCPSSFLSNGHDHFQF